MQTCSRKEFLDNLAESGIASREILDLWLNGVGEHDSPQKIAKRLIESNHITMWQAKYLLAGKKRLRFGGYLMLERISQNNIGDIFVANQVKLNRRVRVLFLNPKLTASIQERPELLNRIAATANIDHPGLEHLHVADIDSSRLMIVTDYLLANSLAEPEFVERTQASDIPDLLAQLFEAVGTAHEFGLTHGAMSEHDILVDDEGNLTVVNIVSSFIVHSLNNETNAPLTNLQHDISTVCRIAKAILIQFPDPQNEGLLKIIGQIENGQIGLLAGAKSAKRAVPKPFVPTPQIPLDHSSQPDQRNEIYASEREERLEWLRWLRRGGQLAATVGLIGLVYYGSTIGWFGRAADGSHDFMASQQAIDDLPELKPLSRQISTTAENKNNLSETESASVSENELPSGLLDDTQVEPVNGVQEDLPTKEQMDVAESDSSGALLDKFSAEFDLEPSTKTRRTAAESTKDNPRTEIPDAPSTSDLHKRDSATEISRDYSNCIDLPASVDDSLTNLWDLNDSVIDIDLLCDQSISKSKIEFRLKELGERWRIDLIANDLPKKIAELQIYKNQLLFQWHANASKDIQSNYLRNCLLKIQTSTKSELIKLRKPILIPDFFLSRDNPKIKVELLNLFYLPKKPIAELLKMDEEKFGPIFLPEGKKSQSFYKKNDLRILFSDIIEYQFVDLIFSADIKNKTKIQVEARLLIYGTGTPKIASTKQLESAKEKFELFIAKNKKAHDFLKDNKIDDLREYFSATKEQLDHKKRVARVKELASQVDNAKKQFEEFRAMQVQLDQWLEASLPVEIFFEVDGNRVVLASSLLKQ